MERDGGWVRQGGSVPAGRHRRGTPRAHRGRARRRRRPGVIDRLVGAIRCRADGGDALWRHSERTTIAFESGRLKACGVIEETGINLRVVRGGKVGVAGTTTADLDDLVSRALASAELGESVDLAFPATGPVPDVAT